MLGNCTIKSGRSYGFCRPVQGGLGTEPEKFNS